MDFTIAIPCRNRIHIANEAIERFLSSCEYPILVIDDVSDTPSAQYVTHERVKIIFNDTKSGYAALVNQCICESKTEYVIIACDKIRVTPADIKRIEDKLNEGFACVCTQFMHIYGFSKDLVAKIGLFDSGFTSACFEDTDWMNRLFVNDLALYFSFETELYQIGSNWSTNTVNQEYYNTKWIERDNQLIQLHRGMNPDSVKLFRGKYKDRDYLPWSKSELKSEGHSNFYANKTAIKKFKTGRAIAFMFHDVRDCIDEKYKRRYDLKSFLTVSQFEKQIKYIIDRYKVISSKQFFEMNEDEIDDEYAILTFDDGLLDHYTNVLPILTHYNISGTFLAPAGPVMENKIVHSHKIQFILACAECEADLVCRIFDKLDMTDAERLCTWHEFSVSNFKDSWWSNEMVFVTNFLRNYEKDRYSIVDELFEEFVTSDQNKFNESFYLNEKHIEELVSSGMEIGGHGYSSENLLRLDNRDREVDIMTSIDFVKSFMEDGFITFSYPNGAYDDSVIRTLKLSGCNISYTTEDKSIEQYDNIDYLRIPRFNTTEWV